MKFCCKLSGLAGLVSGFFGALFLAIATWPIPDGGYVPDPEKIQTEYHFVVMKYPDLYKWGIILICIGFLLQAIQLIFSWRMNHK